MRCTFPGCTNQGEPPPGYAFFSCDRCLEKLVQQLEGKKAQELVADLRRAMKGSKL